MSIPTIENRKGLTKLQVDERFKKYGYNQLEEIKKNLLWKIFINVLKEPMFILLILTALIYFFISKEIQEGLIMIFSVAIMMGISIIQEYKADKSLEKLRELSQAKVKVKRDGNILEVDSKYLVPDDIMIITEGDRVSADGIILTHNDLATDESSLTGESDTIYKTSTPDQHNHFKKNYVYQGTSVVLGSAEVKVTATGKNTETGKIGKSILEAPQRPTPLEKQIRSLVKKFSIVAITIMVAIFSISYIQSRNLYSAIISGITFAISAIPEEFPVVLTIFLSLGAYRLASKNSLIRKLSSVETLGGISVLCVDKTGTLTENRMQLSIAMPFGVTDSDLDKIAALACEHNSYDPMEQNILKHCKHDIDALFSNKLVKEYPFNSSTKMMGHVWEIDGKIFVTAKGAFEGIIKLCELNDKDRDDIHNHHDTLSKQGNRILAVAYGYYDNEDTVPDTLTECNLKIAGLIGFSDPPRKEVPNSIKICNEGGIKVIMITGDNALTASTIGKNIGLLEYENTLTGDQIESMNEDELAIAVKHTSIFARVIPEQKMKIINAIKKNGLVVAMTGDGVNDAPALKYADIGIAMGQRGTNVAKEASDMVLLDDNFATIVETIKDGRRIYDNIKKAIIYVVTCKIPIALLALLVPLFGFPAVLLPVHVVLLELVIDPIAAVVFERQHADKDIMTKKPRDMSKSMISLPNLFKIAIKGIFMFLASFFSYTYFLNQTGNSNLARSFSLSVLILSNLILVFATMLETKSEINFIDKFIKDKVALSIMGFIVVCLLCLIYITPLHSLFKTTSLSLTQLALALAISMISVLWYNVLLSFSNKKVQTNN